MTAAFPQTTESPEAISRPWERWQPSPADPFDLDAAAHLVRRATWGCDVATLRNLVDAGPAMAVKRLLQPAGADDFDREAETMIRGQLVLGDTDNLIDWWLYRMLRDPHGVREKATFLWHGHFCTGRSKVSDVHLLKTQNETLRRGALGSFAALVKAISRDSAMLIYLDSTENKKSRPNENYARELLELFCLGLGNYTESDIKELARCFTGWEVRRRRFRIRHSDMDQGEKSLFGTLGHFGGDEAIDVILAQPAAACHVADRLLRFYISDQPLPALVQRELAEILIANDWEIGPTLEIMFQSRLFYSTLCRGRMVTSPLQFTLGWMHRLGVHGELDRLRGELESMGQVPLDPPNVKGWPAGNTWVDPARMTSRIRWVQRLADSLDASPLPGSISRRGIGAAADQQICEWLQQYLIGSPLSASRRTILQREIRQADDPQRAFQTGLLIAGLLPESHIM